MSRAHAPTIREAVVAALDARLRDVRTCIPARVVSYDPATAKAAVQPLTRLVRVVEGARVEADLPVIHECPVIQFRAGGFHLSMPLAVDDDCALVVADRELDVFLYTGGAGAPAHPRMHSLTDAIVIPGLSSFADPLPARSGTDVVLGLESQVAEIRITPGGAVTVTGGTVTVDAATVKLGGPSASLAVALFEPLQSYLATLTLPHPLGPAGPPAVPLSSAASSSTTKAV